jgi:hypothetical protein
VASYLGKISILYYLSCPNTDQTAKACLDVSQTRFRLLASLCGVVVAVLAASRSRGVTCPRLLTSADILFS